MATSTESRTAGRSLPQPTDLLLVQRGSTPYRATAEEVKAFMLSPATAVAIGAIKPGTNLSVDADGTLHASIPGALTYRGAIDPTTTEAPAGAAVGDVYLASSSGIALASWSGIAGQDIAQGDLLLFDGTNWSANAALGPDGAGVIRIQVAAPLSVDESDPAPRLPAWCSWPTRWRWRTAPPGGWWMRPSYRRRWPPPSRPATTCRWT
jgi:hypothetical protein